MATKGTLAPHKRPRVRKNRVHNNKLPIPSEVEADKPWHVRYPTSKPVAKHDILCSTPLFNSIHAQQRNTCNDESSVKASTPILSTMESLNSTIAAQSVPSGPRKEDTTDVVKLATIYTYQDAPTTPKPLHRSLRIWRLVHRSAFDAATNYYGASNFAAANEGCVNRNKCLPQCTIAVKLPSVISPNDIKSQKNSKAFHNFIQYLHTHKLAAMLECDSIGRIGFILPGHNYNDAGGTHEDERHADNNDETNGYGDNDYTNEEKHINEEYAAYLYYRHMLDSNVKRRVCSKKGATVSVGLGACQLKFDAETLRNVFHQPKLPDGMFGLQYTFSLVEGTNHAAGVGDAVNLPEWLVPIPALKELAEEVGLELEYATNFHKFYEERKNPDIFPMAHNALYKMKVLNKNGSISDEEWEISRMYIALKFRKVKDSSVVLDGDEVKEDDDEVAATAASFYSGLTRTLDTRADSRLYHMRAFNGWVKATQIAELDPDTTHSPASTIGKKQSRTSPIRVLDLACGKGGDLGKWAFHPRKLGNYVGVDVARGSLLDAAIRARQMSKQNKSVLKRCTFTLADLGEDVPGRKRSVKSLRMQKLLTWSLHSETPEELRSGPVFKPKEGGGIAETDRFDVVSIQFAIHYMMSSLKRARRFFHTVSSLLETGGNLIATTIDARVVVEKLMGLGLDYHFDNLDYHPDVDNDETADTHHNDKRRKVGQGAPS